VKLRDKSSQSEKNNHGHVLYKAKRLHENELKKWIIEAVNVINVAIVWARNRNIETKFLRNDIESVVCIG